MVSEDLNNHLDPASPFASVAALKTTHTDLLKRYRQGLGSRSIYADDSQVLISLLPEIEDLLTRGRITGRLIDTEDDRSASQAYLDYWVNVIYRSGLTRDDSLHLNATLDDFDPGLAPAIPEELCPYIGLDAFQEQNTAIFYGRKKLVAEMLTKLQSERLLAVVGPSGSGKSSAVLAGLLPELRKGGLSGSEKWNYYPPLVPSANPLRSLALAVRPQGQSSVWVDEQVRLFKESPQHLLKLFEEASTFPSVLLVDQFEEVFTLCHDEQLLKSFIQNLSVAAAATSIPHRIALTMRIEFQEQMPRLDTFYPLYLQGLVQVLPLSVTDLHDAIEKPAADVGLKFEQGIVDNLVKEIVGEPAGLPLLQFTLLELWRRRRRNRVLLDDYNKLGGARKALTNVASSVVKELSLQEQTVAKRTFLRLAWAGESVEVLRNRVPRRSLHKAGGSSDQVDAVLRKLVAARLIRLTKDEFAVENKESLNDQFEVAHEALIRNWQMLIDWLQAERETLRHRIRVRSAAEQWLAHGKDPGGLLGGSLLIDAAKYTDLDDLEKEFIKASQDVEEANMREREATRLREMDQLQAIAAQKTRAARLLRVFVGLLAVGLLITGILAIYAGAQRRGALASANKAQNSKIDAENALKEARIFEGRAKDEAKRAEDEAQKAKDEARKAENEKTEANRQKEIASNLQIVAEQKAALAAQKEADAKQAREIAVAARAEAVKSKKDAEDALASVTKTNEELQKVKDDLTNQNARLVEETKLKDEAISQAKENFSISIVAQNDLTRELREQQALAEQIQAKLSTVTTFSADGSKLLTFPANGNPRVWDTKSGRILRDDSDYVVAAALSSDGRRLATAGVFGDVLLKDIASGSEVLQFESGSSPGKLVFSSDSQKLAVLDDHLRTVKVFDLKTGKEILDLSKIISEVAAVAFSPDGQNVALTTSKGESVLVNIGANQVVKRVLGNNVGGCRESAIDLLNFSPSRDLKASLRVETKCQDDSDTQLLDSSRAERLSQRGLSPEQTAALLGPVVSGSETSKPSATSTRSPAKATMKKPPEVNQGPVFRLVFTVYRKVTNVDENDPFEDPFAELCSVSYSVTAGQEVAAALEKLARKGISGGDVRDISDAINELAKKFSEIPGDDKEPAKIAKLQQLSSDLLRKIMDELNIPMTANSLGGLIRPTATRALFKSFE